MGPGGSFSNSEKRKWAPDPFENQEGAHFGKVSVVCVCGVVCVWVACRGVSDDVLVTSFCAVSLSGTM